MCDTPKADPPCCDDWARARKTGTDSEGVSELIWNDGAGQPCAGGIGIPITFCPWCGHDRRKPVGRPKPEGNRI